MRSDFLDRHSRMDSPIHRLPAAAKLISALALVLCTVLLPPSRAKWLFLVAAILLAVIIISRLPKRFLLQRLLFLEPFVLGVAILALFQPGGVPLFFLLVAKTTLCLLTMVLLANTTPFSELLRSLKAAHVPGLLITTLALMYRYLFVLIDESQRMKRARLSRTFTASHSRNWRTAATVVGQLFIRASERAERIYAAMCARGWQ